MPPKSKFEQLRVALTEDGLGKVYNTANGDTYNATLTTCDCPDAERRGGTYTIDAERTSAFRLFNPQSAIRNRVIVPAVETDPTAALTATSRRVVRGPTPA